MVNSEEEELEFIGVFPIKKNILAEITIRESDEEGEEEESSEEETKKLNESNNNNNLDKTGIIVDDDDVKNGSFKTPKKGNRKEQDGDTSSSKQLNADGNNKNNRKNKNKSKEKKKKQKEKDDEGNKNDNNSNNNKNPSAASSPLKTKKSSTSKNVDEGRKNDQTKQKDKRVSSNDNMTTSSTPENSRQKEKSAMEKVSSNENLNNESVQSPTTSIANSSGPSGRYSKLVDDVINSVLLNESSNSTDSFIQQQNDPASLEEFSMNNFMKALDIGFDERHIRTRGRKREINRLLHERNLHVEKAGKGKRKNTKEKVDDPEESEEAPPKKKAATVTSPTKKKSNLLETEDTHNNNDSNVSEETTLGSKEKVVSPTRRSPVKEKSSASEILKETIVETLKEKSLDNTTASSSTENLVHQKENDAILAKTNLDTPAAGIGKPPKENSTNIATDEPPPKEKVIQTKSTDRTSEGTKQPAVDEATAKDSRSMKNQGQVSVVVETDAQNSQKQKNSQTAKNKRKELDNDKSAEFNFSQRELDELEINIQTNLIFQDSESSINTNTLNKSIEPEIREKRKNSADDDTNLINSASKRRKTERYFNMSLSEKEKDDNNKTVHEDKSNNKDRKSSSSSHDKEKSRESKDHRSRRDSSCSSNRSNSKDRHNNEKRRHSNANDKEKDKKRESSSSKDKEREEDKSRDKDKDRDRQRDKDRDRHSISKDRNNRRDNDSSRSANSSSSSKPVQSTQQDKVKAVKDIIESQFPKTWTKEMVRFYSNSNHKNFSEEAIRKVQPTSNHHWRAPYDEQSTPNQRDKIKCLRCKQWGHFERSCTEDIRYSCLYCGRIGHNSATCKYNTCLNCGTKLLQNGTIKSCQFCERDSYGQKWNCSICGMESHNYRKCPDKWRRYFATTTDISKDLMKCEEKKIVPTLEYKQIDSSKIYKKTSSLYCAICFKKGHNYFNCTSTRSISRDTHLPNKPKVIEYLKEFKNSSNLPSTSTATVTNRGGETRKNNNVSGISTNVQKETTKEKVAEIVENNSSSLDISEENNQSNSSTTTTNDENINLQELHKSLNQISPESPLVIDSSTTSSPLLIPVDNERQNQMNVNVNVNIEQIITLSDDEEEDIEILEVVEQEKKKDCDDPKTMLIIFTREWDTLAKDALSRTGIVATICTKHNINIQIEKDNLAMFFKSGKPENRLKAKEAIVNWLRPRK